MATGGAWSIDLETAVPVDGPLSLDTNGTNAISVTATDAAGNISTPGTQDLTIDSTVPAAPAITTTNTTTDATPVIGGTAEAGATITLTIGGATYTTTATEGVWSIDLETAIPVEGTLSLNLNGTNAISVTATDGVGNISVPGTQSLAIDSTVPDAPTITSAAATNDTTPVISGTAEAGATITVAIGGVIYTTVATEGVWSIDLETAVPVEGTLSLNLNGTNAISVTATDGVGNISVPGTQDLTIDSTAPAAPAITTTNTTTDATPVIGGTAEAGATVTLVIGGATYTTTATGGVWSIDLETATPASGTLVLNTAGANALSVTARDAVGNLSPAATQSLTIGTTSPTNPTNPSEPTGPTTPTEPANPTDPTTPTEPTNPGVPPVVETKIDGVTVGTTVTTGTNGQQSQVITIPVVTPDRVEDRVDGARADIPLVTNGTVSVLEAGLPTGVGMRVEAPSLTAQTGTNARLTLIEAIESRTTGTDQQIDRTAMTGLGNQFLDTLPTDGNLLVRIVTPTIPAGTTTAPSDPIVITGSTSSSSHEGGTGPQVALVIDVRGLPPGTVLQLQDVEFAAIIGAVTVTGGAGRQVVTGDTNAQVIVLGEDDDILFAGGGDDLVGSAGGNDLIHGEEGNDRMFGGAGNDTLDGGSGIDAVRFDGAFANFTVTRGGYGAQTVEDTRNASPEGTDTLARAEILRFSDGVTLANAPVKVALTEALYLAANADVRAAVATGLIDSGLAHLVQFGQAEGRLALLSVDEAFYRAENADVDRAILNGQFTSAADHFARFGASEGRDANVLFNTDWYLARNTDVADAVAAGLTTAWAHYSNFGWTEGRDPSVWFDTSEYLANHRDVASAGVNPLTHFIEYGFAENRLAPAADSGLWLV